MEPCDIEALKIRTKPLFLLYAEDDEEIRCSMLDILKDFFEHIDTAQDGEEAYRLFREAKRPYDLVMSDIKMPKMNGLELIAQIRKHSRDIATIVTSAYNDSEFFIETIRLNVNGYILKPLELDQFFETLSSTVETIVMKQETKAYMYGLEQTILTQNHALEEQRYNDPLTKLSNKNALDLMLKEISSDDVPALFLITIDQFKNYNKLYGMEIGNDILKAFADVLKEAAQSLFYSAFRIATNEFVMLSIDQQLDPEKIYEDVQATLEALDGLELKVDALSEKILIHISMGVTFDQENLFNKAFTALDFAKQTGKSFVVYTSNLDETESLSNDFYWQDVINDTLNQDNVVPFYQPICNADKRIVKYEALIRIRTKDKCGAEQYVSPYYFLDIARRTKQYDMLSFCMIEKVLEKAQANLHLDFSINFSFRDMLNKEIRDCVRAKIIDYQEKRQRFNLVFEVVESEKIGDFNTIKHFLKYVKYEKAPIAIDDFGTGYSNFTNIMEMHPAYLKIDGSLIKDIDHDTQSFQLVKAIVSFAKALQIKTIAEFVHNEAVFDTLIPLGIDEFQGYFIGKPQQELLN
ncbi:EAL domain-containing protein [Sulfurospirillum cavolei]|uniref:EAL domain-containing protein n=1 Tax=Sulfurospirillum cavolei TaxID=366522 RepID=UPI0007649C0F|nr:EAL domain-containing protein [Sulfurospirillum cavolei]